jgi:hypothetical protein
MILYSATNFGSVVTLATPFVALAFQEEGCMQWARDHDLDEALVRYLFFFMDYNF